MKLNKQRGFTLVELSLAMVALSMLLLFIALLTLQVSRIYNRGLTLRAVDEAGQLIIQDMKQSIRETGATSVVLRTGNDGGRLCAGNTIYAWNTSRGVEPGSGVTGGNQIDGNTDTVRFVKFRGLSSIACNQDTWESNLKAGSIEGKGFKDLISAGDANLYVKSLSVDKNNSTEIVRVVFTLGTNTSDLVDAGGNCQPVAGGGDEFCAVNEFAFTVRAGSKE